MTVRSASGDSYLRVAVYRLNLVESLARQLAFAPCDVRIAQLASAETLVDDLDLSRSYPAAFVTFRITGYHPREQPGDEQLTGLALQHDLGLLIERVSETLELIAADEPEPVLSIDDLTEQFNVTSKTIQRWRKRGLISRRFTFVDGKRRVGFLLSSIERFIARHSDAIRDSNANATLIGNDERDAIVRAAVRQIATHGWSEDDLIRRLARTFRRSAMTILHTLRKYDQSSPALAVLPTALRPWSTARRQRAVTLSRRGLSLPAIARRLRRSRAAIYRVILDEHVERLGKRRVRFHDDELYHTPEAELTIESLVSGVSSSLVKGDSSSPPRGLPPYLADLYRTPLLAVASERTLFLAFNYRKLRFVVERRAFDPETARRRDVVKLERLLDQATAIKNQIVRANLRLVVSVARKHVRPASLGGGGPSLMDLVSEGNLILMRAAESFDVHRNVRFSTYATFALMKGYARLVPELRAQSARAKGSADRALDVVDPRAHAALEGHVELGEVRAMLARLNVDERAVVSAYYDLDQKRSPIPRRTPTFEDVGRRLGFSKHRVRQLERDALAKLRDALCVSPD